MTRIADRRKVTVELLHDELLFVLCLLAGTTGVEMVPAAKERLIQKFIKATMKANGAATGTLRVRRAR